MGLQGYKQINKTGAGLRGSRALASNRKVPLTSPEVHEEEEAAVRRALGRGTLIPMSSLFNSHKKRE